MPREGVLSCLSGCLPCDRAGRLRGLPCGRDGPLRGEARLRSPPVLPGLRGRVHEPPEAANPKVFSAPSPASPTLLSNRHRTLDKPQIPLASPPTLLGHLDGTGDMKRLTSEASKADNQLQDDVTCPGGLPLEILSPASQGVESALPAHQDFGPTIPIRALMEASPSSRSLGARTPGGNTLQVPLPMRQARGQESEAWSPASRVSGISHATHCREVTVPGHQSFGVRTPASRAAEASPAGHLSGAASPVRFFEASTPASRASRRQAASPTGHLSRATSPGCMAQTPASPASLRQAASPTGNSRATSRGCVIEASTPASRASRRHATNTSNRRLELPQLPSAGCQQTPVHDASPVSVHDPKSIGALACEATLMIGERTAEATAVVGEWALEASAAAGQRALQAIKSSSRHASRAAAQALANGARNLDSIMNSYLDELRESLHQRTLAAAAEAESSDSEGSSGDGTPAALGAALGRQAVPAPAPLPAAPRTRGVELQPQPHAAASALAPYRETALTAAGRSASFSQHAGPQVVQGSPQPLAAHRVRAGSFNIAAQGVARPLGWAGAPMGGSFGPLGQPLGLATHSSFDHYSGRQQSISLQGQPASVLPSRHTFGAVERPGLLAPSSTVAQAVQPGLSLQPVR